MHSFEELRKEYPQFVYRGFDYDICDGIISISYDFEISGLEEFHPTWKIRYSDFIKDIADAHEPRYVASRISICYGSFIQLECRLPACLTDSCI